MYGGCIFVLALVYWPMIGCRAVINHAAVDVAELSSIVEVKLSQPTNAGSNRHLDIYCKSMPEEPPKIDTIYSTYYIISVTFHDCPPAKRIVDILSAFGVNLENLEQVTLINLPAAPVLKSSHFEDLENVRRVAIQGVKGEDVRPNKDFLNPLHQLEELKVKYLELGTLPARNKIESVHLLHGSSLGSFGGCQQLLWLTIEEWTIPEEPGWLAYCPKLLVVKLVSTPSLAQVVSHIPTVSELIIKNCSLPQLTRNFLSSARQLTELKINYCNLSRVKADAFEDVADTLTELDLSFNELTGVVAKSLKPLKKLRKLVLCHNYLENFCDHFALNSVPSLTTLYMAECELKRLCFDNHLGLTTLDLSGNKLEELDFDKLPLETSRENPQEILLRNNPIVKMSFSETLYHSLDNLKWGARQSGPISVITINHITCSKDSFWLAQALEKIFIVVNGLQCDVLHPESLTHLPPTKLTTLFAHGMKESGVEVTKRNEYDEDRPTKHSDEEKITKNKSDEGLNTNYNSDVGKNINNNSDDVKNTKYNPDEGKHAKFHAAGEKNMMHNLDVEKKTKYNLDVEKNTYYNPDAEKNMKHKANKEKHKMYNPDEVKHTTYAYEEKFTKPKDGDDDVGKDSVKYKDDMDDDDDVTAKDIYRKDKEKVENVDNDTRERGSDLNTKNKGKDETNPWNAKNTKFMGRYACGPCFCEGLGDNVKAYCHNLEQMPQIVGMKELYASGNNIFTINLQDLNDNLEFIDVRNNDISRIPGDVMKEIFKLPNRLILLSGNPIACDCDNIDMLSELHNYDTQVDFRNLKCKGSNRWLRRISLDSLCNSEATDGVVAIAVNVILLVSTLIIKIIAL